MNEKTPNTQHLKKIGNYILKETIGKGAFSKVKRAVHIQNKENFAIKVVKIKDMDIKKKNQISRELACLKILRNHPNVVKMIEIMKTKSNKRLYIVMELLTGGELFKKIVTSPEKRLDEETSLNYFQILINTVNFCHSKGIIHRDLKVENIMFDSK